MFEGVPFQPTLNAFLNGLSGILILIGYYFIKQNNQKLHKTFFISAIITSSFFLISYLIYHFTNEPTKFAGDGIIKTVYFAILISHTILALVVVVLIIIAVIRAFKEKFEQHKKIAKWAFPIWLYVSVTGVVIYYMLYHYGK